MINLQVAQYPVLKRANSVLLHGPVPPGRFSTKTYAYHIILHVPNSSRMFSLLRTDNEREAYDVFALYKENFPLLVECDPVVHIYIKK